MKLAPSTDSRPSDREAPSWRERLGSPDPAPPEALVETADGGVVEVRRTRDADGVHLVRYDADERVLWSRELTCPGRAVWVTAVVERAGGDLSVVGSAVTPEPVNYALILDPDGHLVEVSEVEVAGYGEPRHETRWSA